MREIINEYRILTGTHKEERPLATPRGRSENNIKMDLRKLDDRVWIRFISIGKGCSSDIL
jgi:hypothetical protein